MRLFITDKIYILLVEKSNNTYHLSLLTDVLSLVVLFSHTSVLLGTVNVLSMYII